MQMQNAAISADIRAFLKERIESYEELQVLLLLKDRAGQAWSCAEVLKELPLPAVVVEAALRELAREQLLVAVEGDGAPRFSYAPGSSYLATSVDSVARCHDESRVAIMKLLTAWAIERLREDSGVSFSQEPASKRAPDSG